MISGKRKTIGLFICKAYTFFEEKVYPVLREECRRLDYDAVVFSSVGFHDSLNDYDRQEQMMFSFAPVDRLDGILIIPDSYEVEGFQEKLREMIYSKVTCPVVALRHMSDDLPCVFTDESEAIRPVIRHLVRDHGLRRIRFLSGYPGHPDGTQREAAYRAEMAACGLPVAPEDVFAGNMWLNCGEEAFAHFFSDPENLPEAVVCANDYMAYGLIGVLRQKGFRVPEDVIVTGFDNVDGYATLFPTLTTVEQDFAGMMRHGVECLDRMIREGVPAVPPKIGLPGTLVLGESCGCCARDPQFTARQERESTAKLSAMTTREVSMTYLTIEMSECESLSELHDVLIRKKNDTPEVEDIYLCLFQDGRDDAGAPRFASRITDTACLVHAMRDQQDNGVPMISFDRKDLLPPMAERADQTQLFFLTLLHQKDNSYGYLLIRYRDGALPSSFYQQWTVILSGALRNMDRRNELLRLYEERRLSSITDPLTRLLNRRGLEEKITPLWPGLCAQKELVAFICIDLDHLKQINDTYGHQAGDYAIRTAARAIQKASPPHAVSARTGGDEFLVFLPVRDPAEADRWIPAFRAELDRLNREERRSFAVEASVGAKVIRLDEFSTVEQCIHETDLIMYRIKEEHHQARKD